MQALNSTRDGENNGLPRTPPLVVELDGVGMELHGSKSDDERLGISSVRMSCMLWENPYS